MGIHVSTALLLSLLLLSLLVKFDASDAYSYREHRKLADSDGKFGENPTRDPPVPIEKNSDPNKKKAEPPPPTNNDNDNNNKTTQGKGIDVGSINNNNTSSPAPSPTPTLKDSHSPQKKDNKTTSHSVAGDDGSKNNPKDDGKESSKDGVDENKGNDTQSTPTSEICDKWNCTDNGEMFGCISKLDRMYVIVLLRNGGKDNITVNLKESDHEAIVVSPQEPSKVNISLIASERTQLIFNAGHGDCVLHMGAVISNRFVHLPSYEQILTPVNGAYFLILTVLVFGGTWACCKFRKKRNNEVPYQELEMAMPESAAATNMESAEGWDQVWDDDWDDDVAVKPPGHARSISANGLTSRSSNKDGWEDNWDD